jgi:hypothetical protein
MSPTLNPCPFCGYDEPRAVEEPDGWRVECPACSGSTYGHEDMDTAAAEWNDRPIEDALRAERDAALARVGTAERDRDTFRGAFLATKTERAAALRAEVARLRTLIAEAAADLPLHPEGAHLTPPEADAEAVRQALLAALRGEA